MGLAVSSNVPRKGGQIVILCADDGLHGGGTCQLVSFVMDTWRKLPNSPAATVIDTRGAGPLVLMPAYFLRAACCLLRLRLGGRVRIVHVIVTKGASFYRKALLIPFARVLGIPVIAHHHAGEFTESFRRIPVPIRALVRRALRSAEISIVLGARWRDTISRELGLPSNRVLVLMNAVPEPTLERIPAKTSACRLLFVGRVETKKGVDDLMAALSKLPHLDWTLTLAGGGELRKYRRDAAAMGMASRMVFLGHVARPEVDQLFAAADILLLPSHYEAMPLVLLEAMAAGVPAIVTPLGAVPEFAEDGVSAIFVAPRDPDHLAQTIARMIEDRDLRDAIARNAKRIFAEHFSMERYAETLLNVYADVEAGHFGRGYESAAASQVTRSPSASADGLPGQ